MSRFGALKMCPLLSQFQGVLLKFLHFINIFENTDSLCCMFSTSLSPISRFWLSLSCFMFTFRHLPYLCYRAHFAHINKIWHQGLFRYSEKRFVNYCINTVKTKYWAQDECVRQCMYVSVSDEWGLYAGCSPNSCTGKAEHHTHTHSTLRRRQLSVVVRPAGVWIVALVFLSTLF